MSKPVYQAPTATITRVELGVFGEYGQDVHENKPVVPVHGRVLGRFLRMDP